MLHHTRAWLLLLSFVLFSVLAACGSASPEARPAAQVAEAPTASATTINVTAKEFAYTLDQIAVAAGSITFVVQNSGAMPHDFAIQVNGGEQKTPMLNPGQSTTLQVTLPPGLYTYRCTVLGHDILGMKGTLTVNATSE